MIGSRVWDIELQDSPLDFASADSIHQSILAFRRRHNLRNKNSAVNTSNFSLLNFIEFY